MVQSKITGPTELDPSQTYTVTNRDGSTFTGGGVQAAEWANYWANDPTSTWFDGQGSSGTGSQGAVSDAPWGRDVFSNFGGVADVSFEHVIRHFTTLTSRFPERKTPGPNDDEPPPAAFIEWGASSDFYEEDTPTDPVEDLNGDAYGMPTGTAGTGDLSSAGVGTPTAPTGTNSGLPGTTNMAVGAGMKLRPRPRKPQDRRPGVQTFEEIDRHVQRGLVFNPKDREQWVIIERILSIRFRGKGGVIMKFNMKPPPFPPSPQDPVTPP